MDGSVGLTSTATKTPLIVALATGEHAFTARPEPTTDRTQLQPRQPSTRDAAVNAGEGDHRDVRLQWRPTSLSPSSPAAECRASDYGGV